MGMGMGSRSRSKLAGAYAVEDFKNTWNFREAYFNYVLSMGGKSLNQPREKC